MYYTCDLAMREGWFAKARARGSWKIEVAFDLRSTDYIYLPLNGSTKLEACYLTPASVHLQGRDWHEVRDCFALDKQAEHYARSRKQHSNARLHAQKEQIISEAREKTQAALAAAGSLSKSARRSEIRANRAREKQNEREAGMWRLGTDNADGSGNSVLKLEQEQGSQNVEEESYVPPASKLARIRSFRNKEWQKGGKRK
jgi:hypothetical protein